MFYVSGGVLTDAFSTTTTTPTTDAVNDYSLDSSVPADSSTTYTISRKLSTGDTAKD
jgi:hypothetical protein